MKIEPIQSSEGFTIFLELNYWAWCLRCMRTMGGPSIIQITNELSPTLDKAVEALIDKGQEIEHIKQQFAEELERQVSFRRAKDLGLMPVYTLEDIKSKLNEKIIHEVKKRKLRHADVADVAQIYRPRVTCIMNRRLNRVSLDLLVRILNLLGIDPELKV